MNYASNNLHMNTRGKRHCNVSELNEGKFHVERLWVRRKKVCSNGNGYVTMMAAMPISGKTKLSKSSPKPMGRRPINLVCSIEDLGRT